MSNVLPPPPPPPTGLAFPPHHGEPAPPQPPQHQSRPRDDERPTRKRASLFDRTKVLLLLGGIWMFLVMATAGENELLPLSEAMRRNLRGGPLLLVIAFAAELLRQIHYLIAESSPAYHQSWKRTFAGSERLLDKLGDYNRFRIGRAMKLISYLIILAIVLGAITHTSPITALIDVPARVISWLPVILQFALAGMFMIFQFAAIFWFLSKGGVDVYHPDEVRTRFSDVWGQDHVVERVRENLVFLENPERIEEKGGYVPSGILLWGPPGTGKTLLAEATAGETGKPFVFIDPGAFKAMFIGIDVLKVKSLFRRARRLAVRYGGVVLFFDEADTLGNRGQLGAGGFGQAASLGEAWAHSPSCNGFHYISEANQTLLARQAFGERPGSGPGAQDHHGRRDGWWRWRAPDPARRALRSEEATRLHQPLHPQGPRHAAEAAAEVPDPRDDGLEHARGARRGAAAARAESTASTRSATRRSPAGSRPMRATSPRSGTASRRKRSNGWRRRRPMRPAPRSRTS